jgi:hypothetical protein
MQLRPVIAGAGLLAGTLVALSPATAQAAPTRYEAESSPSVCTGTIDSDWAGYSGSGFCNGNNAVGAYVQFTVTAPASGTATLNVRFDHHRTPRDGHRERFDCHHGVVREHEHVGGVDDEDAHGAGEFRQQHDPAQPHRIRRPPQHRLPRR